MKHGLGIRGDSYYCPLSFCLDSYWNCEVECLNCFLRKLNRTWGKELRPTDPETLKKKLVDGLGNKNPITSLAWAIKQKKTIRFGNKSDPFQPAEKELRVSVRIMKVLIDLRWTFVIQTKNTDVLREYSRIISVAKKRGLVWIMPVVSPGLERDWEVFERKRTTNPIDRIKFISGLAHAGVNGEPFIPGYHTERDFVETLKLLKSEKIQSYNTYNLHLNDWVAKNLAELGLDIEKIWIMNKDKHWKPILRKLMTLADQYGIILGCPDFVNSGMKPVQKTNTCCGLDVPNPTTFNSHHWKRLLQNGYKEEDIIRFTWDHIGEYKVGSGIVRGTCNPKIYSLLDIH